MENRETPRVDRSTCECSISTHDLPIFCCSVDEAKDLERELTAAQQMVAQQAAAHTAFINASTDNLLELEARRAFQTQELRDKISEITAERARQIASWKAEEDQWRRMNEELRAALADLEHNVSRINRYRDTERHPDVGIALTNARTLLAALALAADERKGERRVDKAGDRQRRKLNINERSRSDRRTQPGTRDQRRKG